MNENSDLQKQLQLMIQKATRSLITAEKLANEGDYDFASSRAYYAAFYAIEAVLLTKNITFSKHAGVISGFNQYFVKTGLFPKETNKLISRLFRERQTGDYDFKPNITEADAEIDCEAAKQIVKAIENFLVDNGCLSIQNENDKIT
jgi:uncharacterized protein (UPF0332 family)